MSIVESLIKWRTSIKREWEGILMGKLTNLGWFTLTVIIGYDSWWERVLFSFIPIIGTIKLTSFTSLIMHLCLILHLLLCIPPSIYILLSRYLCKKANWMMECLMGTLFLMESKFFLDFIDLVDQLVLLLGECIHNLIKY